MEVVVLRPEGYALPRRDHGQGAARGRARPAARVTRDDRSRARRSPARTSSTRRNGARPTLLRRRRGRCAAARAARRTGACASAGSRTRAPTATSCIACRCAATSRSRTKCSTGRAAACMREAVNRLAVQMAVLLPIAQGVTRTMIVTSRPNRPSTCARCASAAPYIRMYKGKIFVIKAGGGVFRDAATDARLDRAGRDPAPPRHPRRAGARRRSAARRAARGARRRRRAWCRAGASPTQKSIDATAHGAERPDQHAHPGDLPRARHRRDRHQRRRCRPGHARTSAPPVHARERRSRGLRLRRRHRLASTPPSSRSCSTTASCRS